MIILSQYVKDHCNYFQKYHLCFSPQNTLLHWKSLLNSVNFQNNSEITWENIFSKAGEKKPLWEHIYKEILLFYGILVFCVQDETLCWQVKKVHRSLSFRVASVSSSLLWDTGATSARYCFCCLLSWRGKEP